MSEVQRVNRALVEKLLNDEWLSYREIARQAGCSDWTVRSIARELAGDDRPMKRATSRGAPAETSPPNGWTVLAGVIAFAGVIWFAFRQLPPDGGPMS